MELGMWRGGGWADRLKSFCMEKSLSDEKFDYSVYNLGISGDNTDDLLKRFEFETKQRLYKEEEIVFIFAIGINDSQFIHSKNDFSVLANKFQKNIKQFTKSSKEISSKIIFIGLTPVDEFKTNPIPWSIDKSYKNEYIEKYNNIIKSICQKNNVYFIDIFNEFSKINYKKLLEDGLHPNSEGHQKMFEIVRDFLMKEKVIE